MLFLTVALPFEFAIELFRVAQFAKDVKIYDSFPEECFFSDTEMNCLRVELKKSKCIGKVRTDLPVLFEGKSLHSVGKALTTCIARIPQFGIKLKKIKTVPGCYVSKELALEETD